MKNRIIILGTRGFVGKALLEHFQQRFQDRDVLGLSSLELDLEKNFDHPIFSQKTTGTSLVICSGLKRNHGETLETLQRNINIAHNLYRLNEKYTFDRILYLSSCAVYGEDVEHPLISESQALTPTSFYGIAKSTTEHLLQKICGDRLLILRPPTIYSGFSDSKNYDPYGFLYKNVHEEALTLWGDGSEKREFLYLNDLLEIMAQSLTLKVTGLLNTCSGNSATFQDILKIAESLTQKKTQLTSKERSKSKVDHNFDAGHFKKTFPQYEFTSLEKGMKKIFDQEFKS